GVESADEPQRRRVRDRGVARGVPEIHRPGAGDLVEAGDVWELAAVVRLVEAGAVHPGVRIVAEPFDLGFDERVDLVEAAGSAEIDGGESEPPPWRVAVRIDETGC